MEAFGPPISVYSKAQAVEDGEQVRIPDALRQEYAVSVPVYVTVGLWGDMEYEGSDDPRVNERMTELNMRSLLTAASMAFRSGDTSDMMRTNIDYERYPDGRHFTVWGVIDGDGVTLMFPEDY